ncbi:hypothetical protein BpHYR1_011664, partial [Brachionus plicatilis]
LNKTVFNTSNFDGWQTFPTKSLPIFIYLIELTSVVENSIFKKTHRTDTTIIFIFSLKNYMPKSLNQGSTPLT